MVFQCVSFISLSDVLQVVFKPSRVPMEHLPTEPIVPVERPIRTASIFSCHFAVLEYHERVKTTKEQGGSHWKS